MANPFYVKSARSGPALQGLADSIRDYKDRQLIDDELQRQEQFREDVMNYDPNQNQQISVEKNVLSDLGIDSISRLDDAAEFKEKIGGLPDDEIYDAVNERITMLTDQGRDASDTAQLLRMRPDDIREAVDTVEEIGFNERVRRMYANNPTGTVNFLNFMKSQQPENLSDVTKAFDDETNMLLENARSRGATPEEQQSLLDRREGMAKSSFGRFYDNYAGRSIRERELVTAASGGDGDTVRLQEFQRWRAMPEGPEKDALGRIIGATPRTASFDERLEFERGKAALKVDTLKDIETDTAKGRAEVEKIKSDLREREVKLNEAGKQREAQAIGVINDSMAALSSIDDLLSTGNFKDIYGGVEGRLPTLTRESLDAEAKRDQVIGLLSLEARQKLRGQGTITDSEAATLERASTSLANPLISDSEAEKELMRVRGIFEKSYQKALENDGVKKAIDDSDAAVLSDDELVSKYL